MKTLTKIIFAAFIAAVVSMPCYADTVTKTTTTITTTFRSDAPIYTGSVLNVAELEELTLEDFQRFGTKPSAAFDAYQEYQQELKEPRPNPTLVIYKMKVIDRDLTFADFQGPNESLELANARFQEYLRATAFPFNGKNARYVYIYHTPVTQGPAI